MKKIVAFALAAALCLAACCALAESVEERFCTVAAFYNEGHVFAKVQNTGDEPIELFSAALSIRDEGGAVLASVESNDIRARYLQPGEYTYVHVYERIEDPDDVPADHTFTLNTRPEAVHQSKRLACVGSYAFGVMDGMWPSNYVYAAITNDTEETIFDVSVVVSLSDEDGKLMYVDAMTLYNCGIAPGNTLVARFTVDSAYTDAFAAMGIAPASADAIAYVDVEVEVEVPAE